MAPRLTDSQKQKIIADYVKFENYRAVGRMNNVAPGTVKNLVEANTEIAQKLAQKKEENMQDILSCMDSETKTVCEILKKILAILNDKEKLSEATIVQLATVMGILIDKFAKNEQNKDSEDAVNIIIDV